MTRVSRESIMEAAAERRARVLDYITRDPPVPMRKIMEMEGMSYYALRGLISDLQQKERVQYMSLRLRPDRSDIPHGLTPSTLRLRQKLGDHLYMLSERGNESSKISRNSVSPRIGLNTREQIRAEERPFNHDWKLSQIERLARELNRDPRELLLSCLTG